MDACAIYPVGRIPARVAQTVVSLLVVMVLFLDMKNVKLSTNLTVAHVRATERGAGTL